VSFQIFVTLPLELTLLARAGFKGDGQHSNRHHHMTTIINDHWGVGLSLTGTSYAKPLFLFRAPVSTKELKSQFHL